MLAERFSFETPNCLVTAELAGLPVQLDEVTKSIASGILVLEQEQISIDQDHSLISSFFQYTPHRLTSPEFHPHLVSTLSSSLHLPPALRHELGPRLYAELAHRVLSLALQIANLDRSGFFSVRAGLKILTVEPLVEASMAEAERRDAGDDGNMGACSICLEDLSSGCKVLQIRCSHAFHQSCIFGWIKMNKNSCPVCRCEIHNGPIEFEAADF